MAKQEVNVRLQRAIKKHFSSTAKLCREWPGLKGKANVIAALVHIKVSPLLCDGTYNPICTALSEAVGILPEKLFPAKLYAKVFPQGIAITTFHRLSKKMVRQLDQLTETLESTDAEIDLAQLRSRIAMVLKSLSYKEREIIKLRYGLGDGLEYTWEEVGYIFKVTRERIRQIEAKAVRKLQQPDRSQRLVSFLE